MLLPIDYVVDNSFLDKEDRYVAGQELSSLGEFSQHGGSILPRVVITPHAFEKFLDDNNLKTQLRHLLGTLNHEHHDSLSQVAKYIKKVISEGRMSTDISKTLFKKLEKTKDCYIEAYYFQGRMPIGYSRGDVTRGEAVVIEGVRQAWAHLYTIENLKNHAISHNNHREFSVCVAIVPDFHYELNGHVKTFGVKKSEYEVEAHSHVRYTYHKHSKAMTKAHILPGGRKDALTVSEIKTLLEYAKKSEEAFYLPQELSWGKTNGKIYITKILPASSYIDDTGAYDFLAKSLTVNPGITIGRLRVINEKERSVDISQDEIVLLKTVDKAIINVVKKAKGIIVESDPHPEIVELLRGAGIPTVIRKRERLLYSTGDIISLNATTGEIRRGSMLVS